MKNRKVIGLVLLLLAIASFSRAAYLYNAEGVFAGVVWSVLAGVTLVILVLVLLFKKTNDTN